MTDIKLVSVSAQLLMLAITISVRTEHSVYRTVLVHNTLVNVQTVSLADSVKLVSILV